MTAVSFLRVYFTGRLITEKHGKPNVTADDVLMAVIERKLKYNAIKSKIKTSYKLQSRTSLKILVHSDHSFELTNVSYNSDHSWEYALHTRMHILQITTSTRVQD